MNDTELDRLLDTWEAAPPPRTMREGLRARFPRTERRRLARPVTWVLVLAAASAVLAIGMEQSGGHPRDLQLARVFGRLYEGIIQSVEAWQATSIVARIRQADPKVYVDGQLGPPLEYGHAATLAVRVPGEGVYSIISYRGLTGWVEAGNIHGSVIEFRVGSRRVRIECNKPIVDSDRPVFARRQP
jgi:hypothetical protein